MIAPRTRPASSYPDLIDILGVSAFYHDSAAALIRDGEVVAAVQQERFSRRKHDASFPVDAARWCLEHGEVAPGELDAVAYYEKPIQSLHRAVTSLVAAGPTSLVRLPRTLPTAVARRASVGFEIERGLDLAGHPMPSSTYYATHHLSHAAAAFHPSPFERAAIVTFDGVGEWSTCTIGRGAAGRIELLDEVRYPDSLGLLYSAFTHHLGFKVNSGEYKVMGLAATGTPRFRDDIVGEVVDLADDGSFRLDLRYFDFVGGGSMTSRRFERRFGARRLPDEPIDDHHRDLASSIQAVLEEAVLRIARRAHALTGEARLVLGGGVAHNCVANGRIARDGPFEEIWVQPAANDAGSAIGGALWVWHDVLGHDRVPLATDAMAGARLGPAVAPASVEAMALERGWPHERLVDRAARTRKVASLLADGAVVGVFQGRAEFGPRALGGRSILADARRPGMSDRLNSRVKRRESFRPFAPAVLSDRADDWFELDGPSPYMSVTATVRASRRDEIPAVTHVDGSARVQTVDVDRSPDLHALLTEFDSLTGCPLLVNTSLNVRGEPMVNTPDEAYTCLMTTDLDWLLIEDCLFAAADQPSWTTAAPEFPPD